eukprot:17112-Rhodomonas_salina.2
MKRSNEVGRLPFGEDSVALQQHLRKEGGAHQDIERWLTSGKHMVLTSEGEEERKRGREKKASSEGEREGLDRRTGSEEGQVRHGCGLHLLLHIHVAAVRPLHAPVVDDLFKRCVSTMAPLLPNHPPPAVRDSFAAGNHRIVS